MTISSIPFDLLTEGRIFQSLLEPFTSLIGADLFYLLLVTSALGFIYIKTRSEILTGLTMMLTGSVLFGYMAPNLQIYLFVLIVFGASLMVYKLFRG